MKFFPLSASSCLFRAFACVLVLMPSALAAQSDEALVEEVRRGQAAARALLEHYRMDYRASFQYRTDAQGQLSTQTRQMEVRKSRDGEFLRLDAADQIEGDGPSGAYYETSNSYLAVNGGEVALWSSRDGAVSGELTVYRHETPASMQINAANALEHIHGLDLVDFAFGFMTDLANGSDDAARIYGRLAGLGAFEAASASQDGRELIEIRYLRGGEPVFTATVAPDRGYATTYLSMSAVDPIDGSESRFAYEISVHEAAEGVWVPDRFRATEWKSSRERTAESSATAEVIDVDLNPDFAPETFQWQGLGYPGHNVHMYDIAGNGVVMATNDRRLRAAASVDNTPSPPEAGTNAQESAVPPPHPDDSVEIQDIVQAPNTPEDEAVSQSATQGPSTLTVVLVAALLLSAAGAVAWKLR